jgi:predicted dehydrogenase
MTRSVAIVGCGYMGARHAWAYARRAPGTRLVLVDRRRSAAQGLAKALRAAGVDATLAERLEAAGEDGPAAADVCTPSTSHAGPALRALGLGWPTLCEKPLTPSPEEEASVLEAAACSPGGWLGVGYPYRHHPAMRWLGRSLSEGRVGAPYAAHLRLGVVGGRRAWHHRLGPEGGGVGNEVLAHLVDLAIQWLGPVVATRILAADIVRPIRRVGGRHVRVTAPDSISVSLRHASGCRSVLTADMAASCHFQSVEVQGGRGSLWASVRPGFPAVLRRTGDDGPGERLWYPRIDLVGAVIDSFVSGWTGGATPPVLMPQPGIAPVLSVVARDAAV